MRCSSSRAPEPEKAPRWRGFSITLVATGAIALASAFVMPRPVLDTWVGAVRLFYGPMAVIFGGLLTVWWHKAAKAEAVGRRVGTPRHRTSCSRVGA